MDEEETYDEMPRVDEEEKPEPKKKLRIGSAKQVYNGTAEMTSGRLRKEDLMKNKRGKIVSKKKYEQAMKLIQEGKLKPFSK